MKWRTHIAIARAISKSLRIPPDLGEALSKGSIDPDKNPDRVLRVGTRGRIYVARMSHHDPDLRVMMMHIWDARLSYLSGHDYQAMLSLGRTLHYIQDKCVSKGFLGFSHDARESEVSNHVLPVDMIEKGKRMSKCSPHYVKKVLRCITPSKNIGDIMTYACLYSATIAEAVLGTKTPPENLIRDYRSAKERYRKRTIPLAISSFLIVSFTSIVLQSYLYIGLGILLAFIIPRADLKYHYLKEEAKWFGMM